MTSFDLSLPRPRATNWGHWGAQVLIGSVLASIAMVLKPLPYDSPLAVIAPVSVFLLVIASWVLMRRHDRQLCENCMASMPLDAAAQATRYRRRFTVTHLGSDRRIVVAYLLVLIGSNFLLLGSMLPQPLGQYLWALIQSTMIYLVLSYSTHRKLQPWCARCSGGGGENEQVDAPEPAPSGSHRG